MVPVGKLGEIDGTPPITPNPNKRANIKPMSPNIAAKIQHHGAQQLVLAGGSASGPTLLTFGVGE